MPETKPTPIKGRPPLRNGEKRNHVAIYLTQDELCQCNGARGKKPLSVFLREKAGFAAQP